MKIFILLTLFLSLFARSAVLAADKEAPALVDHVTTPLRHIQDEGFELVSAPFARQTALLTAGVMGVTAITFVFDKELSQRSARAESPGLSKAGKAGALLGDPILHLGFAGAVYGLGIAGQSPKWKETGEMIGEALVLADASTFLIKEASGRGRPNVSVGKGDFRPFGFKNDYDSFPSMHTASSFALASVLSSSAENVGLKIAYYTAAAFVGFSRIQQNKHWGSDVVFGALLGEACGRIVTHYHASKNTLALAPAALDQGVGLALVGKW